VPMQGNGSAVRLGVVPTERHGFGSRERLAAAKARVWAKLCEMGIDIVNIDGATERGTVFSLEQIESVVGLLKEQNVDALFVPHCNFGTEEIVCHIARELNKPVLLWGERDFEQRSDVSLATDRQCGLFATSKVLRRFNIPFSYINNCRVEDSEFAEGLRRFVAASAVVKAFRSLRIGQIGTRPSPFLTMMYNEGELLEKFGIEVAPVSLTDIIEDARALLGSAEQEEQAKRFREQIPVFEADETGIAKMAALKLAVERWAQRNKCNAVIIQCWSALQRSFGIGTCFVNAALTDAGLPVGCECDVHGAVTSVLLEAASLGKTRSFFADLTIRHPENDNAELLWHCGPFPFSLWDSASVAKVSARGQAFWRIKGGDVTVARFDGDHGEYALLVGEGKGVEGPETYGTYLWLEVKDWPEWEKRFIYGPYVHHVSGIHGRVTEVLAEAVKYLPGLRFERLP
jgi:L-fucose isomerase-like protein